VTIELIADNDILEVLIPGESGPPGSGVPSGGTTGQKLIKLSNTSGDVGWTDDLQLASQAEAEAGSENTKVLTSLRVSQAIGARIADSLTSSSTTLALSAAQGKVLQDSKAPLDSAALTGTPSAPTPSLGNTSTRIATTQFVADAVAAALSGQLPRSPVKVVAAGNISLSGLPTIDGYAVQAGDAVLVAGNTAGEQNGPYIAAVGAWSRRTDFDTSGEAVTGASFLVTEGTIYGGTTWTLLTPAPITLDTTPLTFSQTNASGGNAGNGLVKSGNTLSLAPLAPGQLFVGNGSSVATATSITGDVLLSSGGVTSIAAGAIVNADINASAAIADTKLATISTAGKVANSATTATSANTASAIVARDGSGNFSAGTITAALSGNATTATTLAAARTFAITGDGTAAAVAFNGSANVSLALTLASTGVAAGTYNNVTVDAKGRVTSGFLASYAGLASPAFTGTPSGPTAATGNTTTQLATTAFVAARIAQDAPSKTGTGASGTWGISITGSAASVNGTTGVFSGDVTAASLNGGQLAGLRNRLINGGMAIDQRNEGASHSIPPGTRYTLDRWQVNPSGGTVTGERIESPTVGVYRYRITGGPGVTSIDLTQRIESQNIADLASKTVTLSVDIGDSLLTTVTWIVSHATAQDNFGSTTQIATGTWTVNSTVSRYSAQISLPVGAINGVQVLFRVGAQTSGTWTIGNAQLEQGGAATPFERRPIGTELALCLRYYEWCPANLYLNAVGAGNNVGNHFMFAAVKRAVPTMGAVVADPDLAYQQYINLSLLAPAWPTRIGFLIYAVPAAAGLVSAYGYRVPASAEL
jgi:hypothetical protein